MSLNVDNSVRNASSIRWELVDLKKQRDKAGSKGLTSDTFSLQTRPLIQFALFINSGSMSNKNTVRVILKQFDDKPLETNVKLWIESVEGQKFNETFVVKHEFGKVDDFCGYKEFDNNEHTNFCKFYQKHENFYICCELVDSNVSIFPTINCEQKFIQDFWALYEEEFYDTIIKVDDKEFKVMKAFFIAHSKVFKSMFTSNFKEGIKNEIEIKDVDEETMKNLIKWLYTSQFEEDAPIEKLFAAADKYDIALLKEICTQRMIATLDGNNVFQRLIIANLHSDIQLKEALLNYIDGLPSVHFVNFFTSDEWNELNVKSPTVASDVGKLMREKMNK